MFEFTNILQPTEIENSRWCEVLYYAGILTEFVVGLPVEL